MVGHVSRALVLLVSLTLILVTAGCTQTPTPSPSPTPAPTAAPTLPVAPSAQVASPTPVPGSDEAHLDFTYTVKMYRTPYEGIPPNPGEVIFVVDAIVDSDKPVKTDESWFRIEYRKNATAPLMDLEPNTVYNYTSKVIGDGSGPARGHLIIALPEPEKDYQLRPYIKQMEYGKFKILKTYGLLLTS